MAQQPLVGQDRPCHPYRMAQQPLVGQNRPYHPYPMTQQPPSGPGQTLRPLPHGPTAPSGPGQTLPPLPHGPTAPSGPTTHSIGLLWTHFQPIAETYTCPHTALNNRQTSIPHGGIRTRNPSKRAAADPRFIQRGHWDRFLLYYRK